MTSAGYDTDEKDDDTDDTQADDSGDASTNDDQASDNSGQSSDDSSNDQQDDASSNDAGGEAIANAAPHEVDAHRNMIGDALQRLTDQGIDVESLAQRAGVDSADVNELTHGDLANITQYLTQHHPEALQAVSDRYPAAHGILGILTGGGGGFFSHLFGG